jgi:hypothetical protein
MSERKLKVIATPAESTALEALPILDAYGNLEFSCGGCGTAMLIANEGQKRNVYLDIDLTVAVIFSSTTVVLARNAAGYGRYHFHD